MAALTLAGSTTTLATGVFCTVIVAIPDLPRALAATWVVPRATAVTTPAEETVATLEFSTVHVTDASGTSSPDSFCTSACRGSCAFNARVDVAGLTTMAAIGAVASGCVLLHDQLAMATTAARDRRKLNILPLLTDCPFHLNHRGVRHTPVGCDAFSFHRPTGRRCCSPSRTLRRIR